MASVTRRKVDRYYRPINDHFVNMTWRQNKLKIEFKVLHIFFNTRFFIAIGF